MKAAPFLALLLAGLFAAGFADEGVCGITDAVDLFPCAEVIEEGVDITTTTCCEGAKTFSAKGCFCLQEMIDYDPVYFEKIKGFAVDCGAEFMYPNDPGCPAPLPINGFTEYTSVDEVKAAVEALEPEIPPAPPAKTETDFKPAKSVFVDVVLSVDKSKFDSVEQDFVNELADSLGVDPTQIKIKMKSSGSTIITVEVVPKAGETEIPADRLLAIDDAVANPDGLPLDPAKFGKVKATVAPEGDAVSSNMMDDVGLIPTREKIPSKTIGDSVLGIPRINFLEGGAEYEGGFEINSDYAASLSMQGAPGFCMGIIMLVVMILMIITLVLSKIFGATCMKKCGEAYKPRPYSKRQLRISQGIMLLFCGITAAGCFMIYADGPILLDGTKELTRGMTDTVTDLNVNVTRIANALIDASKVLDDLKEDNVNQAEDLKKSARDVQDIVDKAQKDIDDAMDQGAMLTVYIASAILGVAVIIAILAIIGFHRILLFFIIILSILMIASWLVWGVIAITTVFADDLCVAMDDYVKDPLNSDLSTLIPCLDAKTAVKTMNQVRKNVRDVIVTVNNELEEYAGSNPYLKYLCYQYVKLGVAEMCTKGNSPFHKSKYAEFVCNAQDKLGGITEVYPEAKCPFPTQYYSVEVGGFGAGLKQLRCPFVGFDPPGDDKDGTPQEFALAQCYMQRQIPKDMFDKAAEQAVVGQTLIDVIPDVEELIQCTFTTTAFKRMAKPCDDMAGALFNLYYGFLLISFGYFCLWVTLIVVITRLRNKDQMTEGGNGDIETVQQKL